MDHRFTEEDAQRIFALAAERQKVVETTRAKSLTLTELEEAGLAAGIDPAYIRAAAADLLRPERVPVKRTFAGIPVEVRSTRLYDTPFDEDQWTALVLELRELFGVEGFVSSLGKMRQWQSIANEQQMPIRVRVEEEADGARVTVERKSWGAVLGPGLGIGSFFVAWTAVLVSAAVSGNATGTWLGIILILASLLFGLGIYLAIRKQGDKMMDKYNRVFAFLDQQGHTLAHPPELLSAASPSPLLDGVDDEENESHQIESSAKRVRG